MMMAELKQRCAGQLRTINIRRQVVMLHAHPRSKFVMRANFWPALKDSVVRHSGPDPFFYGVPHDHNFSFLTVGYLGPGYWSDYYEYDYGAVVGYPGESVDLRFVEKSRLEEGKVMLYRAHRDIHLQLPADAMSVSLNIVETSHNSVFRDQYQFDLESSNDRRDHDPDLARADAGAAAHYGGEEGEGLLARLRRRPSQRPGALGGAPGAGRRRRRTSTAGSRCSSGARGRIPCWSAPWRGREIARLEAGRAWIAGAHLEAAA